MSLQDEKRTVLTNLAKHYCSVEEALAAIEYLEHRAADLCDTCRKYGENTCSNSLVINEDYCKGYEPIGG